MEAIAGHIARKKNRAKHSSLGFVPHSELAQDSSTPAQNDSAPTQESKPQVDGKKLGGEKVGRTTTEIDEAAIIAIAPKEFKPAFPISN